MASTESELEAAEVRLIRSTKRQRKRVAEEIRKKGWAETPRKEKEL